MIKLSNEGLRLWKLEHDRLKNWLKNAKSSASTMHQVPSIKKQIKEWENQKPGSSKKSNSSNKSSNGALTIVGSFFGRVGPD